MKAKKLEKIKNQKKKDKVLINSIESKPIIYTTKLSFNINVSLF